MYSGEDGPVGLEDDELFRNEEEDQEDAEEDGGDQGSSNDNIIVAPGKDCAVATLDQETRSFFWYREVDCELEEARYICLESRCQVC